MIAVTVLSIALILLILLDSFEGMVLPRRVARQYRPRRLFYLALWAPFSRAACWTTNLANRQMILAWFGPLSMLLLFVFWAVLLIFAFALLNWSIATPMHNTSGPPSLWTCLYFSGVTFFTLGFGDITPANGLGRALAVLEAGTGFGFLAILIGYVPAIQQVFSERESLISMLDARAGSPPTGSQILIRMARTGSLDALDPLLAEWERWCARLLESNISFPVLAYYRSQHDNQSWLAALTAILDCCALAIAGTRGTNTYQAQVTFAMARHAAVDLAMIFFTPPVSGAADRLPAPEIARLQAQFTAAGFDVDIEKLAELRRMYEPFVMALGQRLRYALPPIVAEPGKADNWQSSAWTRKVEGIDHLGERASVRNDHFD